MSEGKRNKQLTHIKLLWGNETILNLIIYLNETIREKILYVFIVILIVWQNQIPSPPLLPVVMLS